MKSGRGPVPAQRVYGVGVRTGVYAIFEAGGKQFRAAEGETIYVEKLDAAAGDAVTFDRVFLVEREGRVTVGSPHVPGAAVTASVVEHGRARKIIVYKYKSKKNYRRKQGHRQPYTKVRIDSIRA